MASLDGEAKIKVFLILERSFPGALRIDLLGTAADFETRVLVFGVARPRPRFLADRCL